MFSKYNLKITVVNLEKISKAIYLEPVVELAVVIDRLHAIVASINEGMLERINSLLNRARAWH